MFLQTQSPNKTCHSNRHVTQHLLHAHTRNFLGTATTSSLTAPSAPEGGEGGDDGGGWRGRGSSDLKSQEESQGRDILGRRTIFCGFHRDLEVARPQSARLKQAIEHQQEALCPCPHPTSLTLRSPSLLALCLG